MSGKEYAEIFDSLAHPTRIGILKALQKENLTFADLKRKMQIESSGHLQHHLSKLGTLIKTDEFGRYCLSELGKDALFVIQTAEREKKLGETDIHINGPKRRTVLTTVLLLLLVFSLASTFCLWNFVAVQGQYYCDVVEGSPLQEDAELRIDPRPDFEEILPGQSFNFTVLVLPLQNNLGMSILRENYALETVMPPSINDTYYKMCFLGFRFTMIGDARWVGIVSVVGPENSQVKAVNPSELPPYATYDVLPSRIESSQNSPFGKEYNIPIMVFGNYTFNVANIGNTTIKLRYEIWFSTVIMERKQLKLAETLQVVGSKRVVRVLWQPKDSSMATATIMVSTICSTALAAFGIYLVNRKVRSHYHQGAT
ncbi:MAG: winged helix-turn-helix domain-containing protein [Candidatus Bathyarchaeales archaeon]